MISWKWCCGGETALPGGTLLLPQFTHSGSSSVVFVKAIDVITEASLCHFYEYDVNSPVCVLQVLVHSNWSGDLYGSLSVDSGSGISADLLLDDGQQHVYVLTNSRVRQSPCVRVSVFFLVLKLIQQTDIWSVSCLSLSCRRFLCHRVRDRQTVSPVLLSETRTVAGVSWREGRSVCLSVCECVCAVLNGSLWASGAATVVVLFPKVSEPLWLSDTVQRSEISTSCVHYLVLENTHQLYIMLLYM